MHINTNLSLKDYIRGYKEMCRFIANAPIVSGSLLLLALAVTAIPFSLFPLKMGAYGLLVTMVVCCVSIHYRFGTLTGLFDELKHQQRLFLPAIVAMTALSWLGYVVATSAAAMMPSVEGKQAMTWDGFSVMGIVVAGAAICVAQLMPYVIAHFCNGLNLSRQQGEHIWMTLMLRWKTFLAFVPVALFVPLAMLMQQDLSAFILLAATVYCTFLMFIVFNVSPTPRTQTVSSSLFTAQGA